MDYSPRNKRLLYLDAMRGLIMVLMALDHASLIAKTHSHEFWGTAMPRLRQCHAIPFCGPVTHLCALDSSC